LWETQRVGAFWHGDLTPALGLWFISVSYVIRWRKVAIEDVQE